MSFALYASLTLAVTLRHEPWRDEADSWLVARDLPLPDAIEWTRAAGTPLLWYAVLAPFARAGLPFFVQAAIHLLIAWASAAILLFRAPFPAATRAAILFSFYFLYHYAVIARSYALGILLLFALLAIHGVRRERALLYGALVALLCNVNAHSAGFAAPLIVAYAIGMRRTSAREWCALAMMLAGMGAAFVQLYTPGYVVPPNVVSPPDYRSFFAAAGQAFLPAFPESLSIVWAVVLMLVIAFAVRRSIDATIFLFGSLAGLWAIYTYLWVEGYRHFGLILVAAIGALWLGSSGGARSRVAMAMLLVSLVASMPLAARFIRDDWTKQYSGSLEMARFIERHGGATSAIAAHAPAQSEAVLVHLPRRTFWYPAYQRDASYMRWDRAFRIGQVQPVDRAAATAAAHFGTQEWLFVASSPINNPADHGLRLLYATREPLMEPRDAAERKNDERYWLYGSR